jgi:hypothetical protein
MDAPNRPLVILTLESMASINVFFNKPTMIKTYPFYNNRKLVYLEIKPMQNIHILMTYLKKHFRIGIWAYNADTFIEACLDAMGLKDVDIHYYWRSLPHEMLDGVVDFSIPELTGSTLNGSMFKTEETYMILNKKLFDGMIKNPKEDRYHFLFNDNLLILTGELLNIKK